MKLTKFSKIALASTALGLGTLTIGGGVYAATRDFRPVLMNFEAYMSEDAIKDIEKKFQYKVFKELNEFSRAIESNRVVGGIASDFEIARLAIGNKIKKIKYHKILRNIEELQGDKAANAFDANGMLKKAIVAKYIRKETMEHMDSYNNFLVDYQGQRIDNDKDGIADEMWEFMLPYYIQDKVVAYTAGVYETGAQNAQGEALTKPLRAAAYDSLNDEEKEKGIRFESQSFVDIAKKLVEKNYNKFTWTEASRDNLLIGSEIANSATEQGKATYSGYVTPQNYKSMIDGFLEVVKQGTGSLVSDIRKNRFVSSGSEILQSLINPNSISDVGIIYNGDALDALSSRDNFSSVPDGQIKYIRPKNNITLLEGWVVNINNDDELNDKIYDTLYQALYKGVDMSLDQLLQAIGTWVKTPFLTKNEKDEYVFEMQKVDGKEQLLWEKNGKSNYSLSVDYSVIPILRNFDYINYSPSWSADFKLFKKMYFNDSTSALNFDGTDITILWKNDQPITIELDKDITTINDEDYDVQKSEHHNSTNYLLGQELSKINYNDISSSVSDPFTKVLLNIYITQQKEQTVYGGLVDENTPKEDIYTITYESIKPISDKLRSELITYYNLKTKS